MALKRWFLLAAFLSLADTCWSQGTSGWRVYKVGDGLPESACSSVTIGLNGDVLTTHPGSPYIGDLNGYTVSQLPEPAARPERIGASPSGQLWAVGAEGLWEWKDDGWVLHPVPEIAAEFRAGAARPNRSSVPLCPVQQGRVLFLLPDRLMEFNAQLPGDARIEKVCAAGELNIGEFAGLSIARDNGLWIAGSRGLARAPGPVRSLQPAGQWRQYLPPAELGIQNFREPMEDGEGGVALVAESPDTSKKMAVHFDGQHWKVFPAGPEKIRYAWRGQNQGIIAVTAESLFRWRDGQMIAIDEIPARQYLQAATEPGGALWVATSDGLFRFSLLTWRSPAPDLKLNGFVHGVAEDAAGRLWFVTGGKLHSLQNDSHREFPLPETARGNPGTITITPFENGTLLLVSGEELFAFHPENGGFTALRTGNAGRRYHLLGALKNDEAVVQSLAADTREATAFEVYDGTRLRPFPTPLPVPEIGNNYSASFAAKNGDLWLGAERGVACWRDGKWRTFITPDRTSPEGAVQFIELADGKIWSATPDKIWEFDGRNWQVVRGGFDRINKLLCARDGSIWVASNNGLHRFWQGAWIENGAEDGLSSAVVREVCEDRQGRIWAATARGLSLYHPEADPDPPRTSIRKLTGDNGKILEGGTLNLVFNGRDKWKYTSSDRLLYSFRLDQRDWSPFQELNAVSFPDLPVGKHYLQVRAMDRNGNAEATPARLEFVVALPWYKETRLVWISGAGLAVALFFAGLAFNRHRQLKASYVEVEKKVAERTRQLEVASRELVHSQKMNALGTLAAGIAHDFNNILSIIKGSAQIIEDNLDDPQKIHTRVDRIKTVVEQGSGIVKAMLGFSRESDGQPNWCAPNQVVEDTIKLLGDRFLREVEVQLEPAANLPEVPASKDFIQQILLNFIFNAAEAMTGRKQVILSTRNLTRLPPGIVLAPAAAAAYVAISVRDFGCGIPPENMPRIFEPFFTTKALSARRGTGLGLSMVYELSKKMEAGLAVESVVNEGSTFTVVLPLREVPKAASGERDERNSLQPHETAHDSDR